MLKNRPGLNNIDTINNIGINNIQFTSGFHPHTTTSYSSGAASHLYL